MSGELVGYELRDGVAVLTLNDAKRRNALSSRLLGELKEWFLQFEGDDAVRVAASRTDRNDGPLLHQHVGDGPPNALAAPRHNRDASFKTQVHCRALPVFPVRRQA